MKLSTIMMRAATVVVAAIAVTGAAHARNVDLEETHEAPFDFPLSPGNGTVPVPRFDTQGGARVLNGVTLTVEGRISAAATAENDSAMPAPDFQLSLSGVMSADFGGLAATLTFSGVFPTDGTVAASDGVADGGPDFWDFGVVSVSETRTSFTDSNLGAFTGAGMLSVTIPASGGFALGGSTDATITVNDFMADGSATVVYEYTLIGGGACCFSDGTCIELTVVECAQQGGTYQGLGTLCVPDLCPPVKGACCITGGACFAVTSDECIGMGGIYQGDLTVCVPGLCPGLTGACCFPDGSCNEGMQTNCTAAGGLYQGDGTTCVPGLCIPIGQGACCRADGSCEDTNAAGCDAIGEIFQGAGTSCASIVCPTPGPRVTGSDKGSLLIFSDVVIKWRQETVGPATLIQDTFLSITNDYPDDVLVQMYFINGDPPLDAVFDNAGDLVEREHPGWNAVDNLIELTANEPTYWSALTGLPKGVSPFTVLDPGPPDRPGRPCPDLGVNVRGLRGYVIAWAVDNENRQIRWNHLAGSGTSVRYDLGFAAEYGAWSHQVVQGTPADNGTPVGTPGILRLNGVEYAPSFDELLFNFQAAFSTGFGNPPAGLVAMTDTLLTLHPVSADLRQNTDGPLTTKASFDIWNQNEVKFSGTHRCITCWDQTFISKYDTPNHLRRMFLQTEHGKARIDGHAADVCNVLDDPMTPEDESVTSIASPLLGVYRRIITFAGPPAASSGSNLVGMGFDDSAIIRYDLSGAPPESNEPEALRKAPSPRARGAVVSPRERKRAR